MLNTFAGFSSSLAPSCFSMGSFESNKKKDPAPRLRNDAAADEIRSLH